MFVLFKNRGLLTLGGDKKKIVDPISKETKMLLVGEEIILQ